MIMHAMSLALSAFLAIDTSRASTTPIVRTDTSATQVTVTIPGLELPGGGAYSEAREERVSFVWPSEGWARGYRIEVLDANGRVLPRTALHHAGIVNPARRQLVNPRPERLLAAGRETEPVTLPGRMGIPLHGGQPLIAYFMLVNPADTTLHDVSLRITVSWVPANAHRRPKDTFPISFDAKPSDGISSSFDVPPGLSVTSSEFTLPMGGRMRAMGAHVHDYAVEMRLEDVQSGRTLARLRTNRDANGVVRRVEIEKFLLTRGGLHLQAGRRYRVVAVYDNPTCETLTNGAMAFLAGPFVPDDARSWPAVDRDNPIYASGLAALADEQAAAHGGHAGHHGSATTRGDSNAAHGADTVAVSSGVRRSSCR